ncbi:MAG: WhiB family transcriptional regulator [Dermatophilaceae bacterium]
MPRPKLGWRGNEILVTWRGGATCLGEDPELLIPIGNSYPAILQSEVTKVVCRRCEVVDYSLSRAMESRHVTWVWGGLSDDERRALKRRNSRAHGDSSTTRALH